MAGGLMAQPLVNQVASIAGQPATVRIGRIASINPVTVTVQDTVFSNVGYIQGWTFHEGETVALLGQSNASGSDPASWLVLPASGATPLGYQAGVEEISFTNLMSFTQVVVFPQAFPTGMKPNVHLNIDSGAGATSQWHPRAISITNTQFTIFVFSGAGVNSTWSNIPVAWTAFPQPQ